MHVALLFPGQGSQYVGMDRDLDRDTFAEADAALGFGLSAIIHDGPEAELTRTEHTQPAIFTVSMARWRRVRAQRPELVPVAAAGHSLGEYGALVAAGSLAFGDAVRILRLRGRAMQEAVPAGVGGMAAVMGVDEAALGALLPPGVEIAALNGPAQIVVAGPMSSLEVLLDRVESARGVAKLLNVSAPFHCSLLSPAGERLAEALAAVPIRMPDFPVLHNVDAAEAPDTAAIRARLVAQVSRPVRWEATVRALVARGVTRALEVGPGRTLAGLVKRIDRSLAVEVTDT